MRYKYPRTFHLPWSLGATSDDKMLVDDSCFQGKEVVVTEKMDGECSTIGAGYSHARSLDSNDHWSRSRLKALQGSISHKIPLELRICGENVFAKHSIAYGSLPDFFLAFSVWEKSICLDWDTTLSTLAELGIQPVPVLYRGPYAQGIIQGLYTGVSQCGGEQEGYVVRLTSSFTSENFKQSVAKFVRKNHVTTDEHWMHSASSRNEKRVHEL